MFHASNGLPAMRPPWASLVAYDLNEGVIKWRTPLGIVRALAAKGITNTGNSVRAYRNGIVATAGGLIFVGTNGDGYVRAFDKDSGKILWEYDLNANPEGIPAVYEVNGRSMWPLRRITAARSRIIPHSRVMQKTRAITCSHYRGSAAGASNVLS
jgi:quinoprotein glucose dehydrogenase